MRMFYPDSYYQDFHRLQALVYDILRFPLRLAYASELIYLEKLQILMVHQHRYTSALVAEISLQE